MFAADSYFKIRFDAAAALGAEAHQLAYAFAVEHLEGIVGKNLPVYIRRQEAARVIAAQAKSGLRQIVGAEREEVGMFSNFPAVKAARGNSIMVPTAYSIFIPCSPVTSRATS